MRGTCVVYTTHYMQEAEELCDRLAIVDHGKLIAYGSLTELRAMTGQRDILRLTGQFVPDRAAEALARLPDTEIVQSDGTSLLVSLAGASRRLPEVFAALQAAGSDIRETTITQPSLESLFIKLTGKELRE